MSRKNKNVTTYFVILALLIIGVVYAILQANLQINGTAKIQANTWDIHFDNIQVNSNSVSIGTGDSAATIDPENNCKIDFSVSLSLPGDFYEFTVDVVNAGTIDGMIDSINNSLKVNGEDSEIPDYLNYTVTYSSGVSIEPNHKLNHNSTETYLVKVEYKTDLEELPSAATLTMSLEIDYVQADDTAIVVPFNIYNVLKSELDSNSGLALEYTGTHQDSFTGNGNEKIYYWYASSDDNANTILDKWNVIFAGFCWEIYRTTDTGGVKLSYNGVPVDGKCTATGENRQIGTSKINTADNSPAYEGYMIPESSKIKTYTAASAVSGSLYGTGVTWDGTNYTLTNTSTSYNSTHHYTCANTTGTCSTVRYYYYYICYITLSGGETVEPVLTNMLYSSDVNYTASALKTYLETWYQNNLAAYTSKLEDTVFCNDRTLTNLSSAGWTPNGGGTYTYLKFKSLSIQNDLSCANVIDQFSTQNPSAPLTYPIGLMTTTESNLLNNKNLRKTGNVYWLFSPSAYTDGMSNNYYVKTDGSFDDYGSSQTTGVRPAISLKPGTIVSSGDGSKNNPYIVN